MKTGSAIDKWKETQTATSRDRDWIRLLQELFGSLGEVTIKPNPKKSLVFRMYLTKSMCSTLIEDLDFSVRACHCLKRAGYINSLASRVATATVSYVGRANYQEAEQYIRDFRAWTSSAGVGLLIEISAVNGRFTLDFLQMFSNPVFVNAFLKELDENGIVYDLQDVNELELPNISLPWTD